MTRARALAGALLGLVLTVFVAAGAQAQGATLSGKVVSESGAPLAGANITITDLSISVATSDQGTYTINIAPARVNNQQIVLRARAFGYLPGSKPVTIRAGAQANLDFTLKTDVNRLAEVVVTGSIEGTERAKVPFAVGRLNTEDIPVPALDPLRALEGKVPGVRIAQTSGKPGSSPEIMTRGPHSLNATDRSQSPLIIVDGAILNVGSINELGGLDI